MINTQIFFYCVVEGNQELSHAKQVLYHWAAPQPSYIFFNHMCMNSFSKLLIYNYLEFMIAGFNAKIYY